MPNPLNRRRSKTSVRDRREKTKEIRTTRQRSSTIPLKTIRVIESADPVKIGVEAVVVYVAIETGAEHEAILEE